MLKNAWLVIDEKPGNANQAIAIAKAMGINYEIKYLKYTFWSFLPNWLKLNSLLGVDLAKSSSLDGPYPNLIISSGRKTAAVSSYLKKMNPASFVVHLMNPDMDFKNFDLICLPFHDQSPKYSKFKNVIYTIGAPCYLDLDKMKASADAMPELKAPFISLMIGGKTKNGDYTLDELQGLVRKANDLADSIKATLLVTTSRRTHKNIAADLEKEITVPNYFYDWHTMQTTDNPYPAFLHLSDYFITTGDSISICSEILATGKPLYVYRKDNLLYHKHKKFLDYLENAGYIRYLNDEVSALQEWSYSPLHEAKKIGQFIEEKLKDANITVSSQNA